MKLTKDQVALTLKKLNEFSNKSKCTCPLCGNAKWELNDVVFEMREFNGGNLIVGKPSAIMPIVSLSCAECGNTLFFSAIKMGLINPADFDDKSSTLTENK